MSYADLFSDNEYSDITIKCRSFEHQCHKVVLCTQSEYFKKLCGKGSQFAESEQKVVELKDDDPDAVESILRQLYFGDYTVGNQGNVASWMLHANVAVTAKKVS